MSEDNGQVIIDLDKLLGIVQETAIAKEKVLHMQNEMALRKQLEELAKNTVELNADWDELLETIGFLFLESPENYDEAGYVTQPIEILEFAKEKWNDDRDRVDYLEAQLQQIRKLAEEALPHLIRMNVEGSTDRSSEQEAFSIPTHEQINEAIYKIAAVTRGIDDNVKNGIITTAVTQSRERRKAVDSLYLAAKNMLDTIDLLIGYGKNAVNLEEIKDDPAYGNLFNAVVNYEGKH